MAPLLDYDCNSEKDMLAAIETHEISQATYEENVTRFFSGIMPEGKTETYSSINYNSGVDCHDWSLQIDPIIQSNTNGDLSLSMQRTPAPTGKIQYSMLLLKALKEIHGATNLVFSKAQAKDSDADVYFIAMKDTDVIGYYDFNGTFP